jgi:hypothetical protein
VGAQADRVLNRFMPVQIRRRCRGWWCGGLWQEPALYFDDGISGALRVLTEKAPAQGQPGAPLLQRREDVMLAAEVHEIAFPVVKLAAQRALAGR